MAIARKEKAREETLEEIKSVARQQMLSDGMASLSLRQIAQQMGCAAPSLYYYFKSRDELVTALIIDAYNALADTLEAASQGQPSTDPAVRLYAMGIAYREWALAHSGEYMLISGNPIPGYHAPPDTVSPARRNSMAFLNLLLDAWREGQLQIPAEFAALPPALRQRMGEFGNLGEQTAPLLFMVVHMWSHFQGLVTLELYHHLQPILGDPADLYRLEVQNMVKRLGFST